MAYLALIPGPLVALVVVLAGSVGGTHRDAPLRGPAGAFGGTLRVGAYSSVTSLVSWIPVIGWIASLYGIYLAIMGIREIHNTSTGKAAIVVLIPAVVVFLLVMLIIAAIGAAIFFGTQQ